MEGLTIDGKKEKKVDDDSDVYL